MTLSIVYNPFTQNFDFVGSSTSPPGTVNFLEGNSGGQVGPDGAATIHVVGTGNITVTGNPGTNTLTISESTGSVITIDGDTGSATPTAGVITFTGGTTGLTFNAAISTVTLGGILNLADGGTSANLTANNGGIFYSTSTQGAILAGTATARQMLQSGASSSPAWSTTTWPATSTINQILYSSSANTISGLATANQAVLTTGTTGIPVLTSLAGDGQLIIGSTAGAPAAANITSSGGTITITNGSNSINLDVAGAGGFIWVDVSGTSATMSKDHGYEVNNSGLVTLTMPSVGSSTFGDTIKIGGFGAGGFIVQCVATQIIHFGNMATSAGGSMASTNQYDQLEITCSTTTTEWFVRNWIGNYILA